MNKLKLYVGLSLETDSIVLSEDPQEMSRYIPVEEMMDEYYRLIDGPED